jgi:hypothetical protein
MRTEREYLDALAGLHQISDAEERRATWRQSMATLAAAASDHLPVPLEGADPQHMLLSVRTALADGLLDDLEFLQRSHAAAALYELAAVLPLGDERREIGRRVAEHLHQGDAVTFVSLATQLAISSRRGLSGPAVRARVALALELPIGSGARADALALALVSRNELAQEWLIVPSTGSLPSRRLAARLLERAAREAARRCALDDSVLAVFDRPNVALAWQRLLRDREPLVWRHVAAARGLLSEHSARFADEIASDLDEELTPTEWRRAAASLAASIAVAPQKSLVRANALLNTVIYEKDPGVASAMLLGLPRAAEVEPEAAEELCTALVRAGGLDAAEALLSLRQERVGGDFGAWACQMARAKLREQGIQASNDDGLAALAHALDQDLRPNEERDEPPTLRMQLEAALDAFAAHGARAAYAKAQSVLEGFQATLHRLESATQTTTEGRRIAFAALRELDSALLETSVLSDLLMLGARGDDTTVVAPLSAYFGRLTEWLVRHERAPFATGDTLAHRTLRIHRLRTLLHAVDADGGWGDAKHTADRRERRLKTFHVLLRRVENDGPSPLKRVVTAAAARAGDALLREEIGETSDVFLAVSRHVASTDGLTTMAEASMVPEMAAVFRAYALFIERTAHDATATGAQARATFEALRTLIRTFPTASSARVDALRGALLSYCSAIERAVGARALSELAGDSEPGGSRVAAVERATRQLARMLVGALRRLGVDPGESAGVAANTLRYVDIAVERAYRGDRAPLGEAIAEALGALHEELPPPLAEIAASALVRAMELPTEPRPGEPKRDSFRPAPPKEAPLPPWLPPSRTLGGFYVVRALGSGAVGSVFVARRSEEKKNDRAERFALKVPEYTGAAARTLSEEEFMRLFREEAGALLAIPEHENLARLVTFDAGARPKPILVMELVEGPTLERVVETGALDIARTLEILDGIAAGLEAMHEVDVGHLDLKPSNVILRDMDPLLKKPGVAVLVDFGLAGRLLRPGCATACYGAPEVWGLVPKGHKPSPMAADVYAFGCVAFEMLTGRELVSAGSEVGIITAHLSHDGDFEGLEWLAQDPQLAPVAQVLGGAVRQDPRQRVTMSTLRAQLAEIAPTLAHLSWPLRAHAAA